MNPRSLNDEVVNVLKSCHYWRGSTWERASMRRFVVGSLPRPPKCHQHAPLAPLRLAASSRTVCPATSTFPIDTGLRTANKRSPHSFSSSSLRTRANLYTVSPTLRPVHPQAHSQRQLALLVQRLRQDAAPRPILQAGGHPAGHLH